MVNDDMPSANKTVCLQNIRAWFGLSNDLFVNMGRFPNCLVDGANKIDKFKNLKHQRRKNATKRVFSQ